MKGWAFSLEWRDRIIAAVKLVESFRMTGAVHFHKSGDSISAHVPGAAGGGGGGAAAQALAVRVETEHDNHLVCREVGDDGEIPVDEADEPTGPEILVVKPPLLRHAAGYYPGVDWVTTEAPDEIKIDTEDDRTERWVVNAPYEGALLIVDPVPAGISLNVAGKVIGYMDRNVDARKWAKKEHD